MLVLRDELKKLWHGKDVFSEVQQLAGTVVRDKEGRQTLRFELAGKVYYRKLHTGIGWKEVFKNLVQGRLPVVGAKNEWDAINRLKQLGLDTMHAVGYGKRGMNPASQFSFVITEELSGTISLAKFVETWRQTPPPLVLKRALIKKVAEIAACLRDNGINHRDLYICHFLLDISHSESLEPNNLRLFLVDLHRAQMRDQVPWRWLVKDVGSIYFSAMDAGLTRRDYFRFMKLYSGRPLRETLKSDAKFWGQVERRAKALYADGVRKGIV